MTCVVKRYAVRVRGWSAIIYETRTPAQARARCWRDYQILGECSFRDFLKLSTISRAADLTGFGRSILVGGQPAHWVGFDGQYVLFVRPGDDVVLLSHPLDVLDRQTS